MVLLVGMCVLVWKYGTVCSENRGGSDRNVIGGIWEGIFRLILLLDRGHMYVVLVSKTLTKGFSVHETPRVGANRSSPRSCSSATKTNGILAATQGQRQVL
jgi:hypothetical protein